MSDIKKRMAVVRAQHFRKHGGYEFNVSQGLEARRRAETYFGTNDIDALAMAMAEVLFGPPGRGRKKGTFSLDWLTTN